MDAAGEPVIAAVSALGDVAQTAGVVVAALLAGGALLARSDRARAAAMLAALTLVPVLLVASIWSTPQLQPLRDRPLLALIAAGAGLIVLALGALAIQRMPELLALAAAAALPFRIPIESGGDTANLLVPLYLVIAAGVLAYALPRLRAAPGLDDDDDEAGGVRRTRLLEWLLAGTVVLYAAQAAYSSDFDRALSQVIFFYVPFALLFALLVRIDWTPRLAGRCLAVLLVLAVAFVGIGFVEYGKRELLLNPKVIASNQLESYFRVNSLFFDPNIYGRFLVTVMLGLTAVLLWCRRTLLVAGSACALVLLWAGLVLTLSQSSFTALLGGLAVLGALRWGFGRAAAVVAVFAAAAAAVVLVAPGAVGVDQSTDAVTSGRSTLVEGGVELARERPVAGWGAGSFRREYRRQEKTSSARASAASHTIPITIAAEQGVGGLVLYLALLAVALAGLLRGARESVARAAVAAAFVALVVHTLLYAAFLEDPLAWALLAVGAALSRAGPAGEGPARRRGGADPGSRQRDAHARRACPPVTATRERLALAAMLLTAVAAWALVPTYPDYDAYHHLLWGRDLLHGVAPGFEGFAAPTQHPLYLALAALLSLAGEHADRLLVLTTMLCLVALVAGSYILGRTLFGTWPAVLGALFVGSSFAFLLYAVRAFVDVPFLALVVWAAALEAARPRRGVLPMALLAAAGLLRPEAWVLAGVYWLWCLPRPRPPCEHRAGRARRVGARLLGARRSRRHRRSALQPARDEQARRGARPRPRDRERAAHVRDVPRRHRAAARRAGGRRRARARRAPVRHRADGRADRHARGGRADVRRDGHRGAGDHPALPHRAGGGAVRARRLRGARLHDARRGSRASALAGGGGWRARPRRRLPGGQGVELWRAALRSCASSARRTTTLRDAAGRAARCATACAAAR